LTLDKLFSMFAHIYWFAYMSVLLYLITIRCTLNVWKLYTCWNVSVNVCLNVSVNVVLLLKCLLLRDHCAAGHLQITVICTLHAMRFVWKCKSLNLARFHVVGSTSKRPKTVERRRVFHVNVYISLPACWIVVYICIIVEKKYTNNYPAAFREMTMYTK
jgi:hypothetical protein